MKNIQLILFNSYGIRLATTLTKLVIERGYQPFVVIRPQNDASRNLYTKLGFEKAYETCRVKLNPGQIQQKIGLAHTNGILENTENVRDVVVESCAASKEILPGHVVVVDDDDDPEANKENQPIDEGIEDMLAEKCDISKEEGSKEKPTDEGIEEDK